MPTSPLGNKLARVRPPRVRITYEVELGGAIELRELPFVVGVLADLTAQPEQPMPRLRYRKFAEITQDNFDSVLDAMKPHLTLRVENKLTEEEDSKLNVAIYMYIQETTLRPAKSRPPAIMDTTRRRESSSSA